ncbi:MAG: hypothetical protein ACRD3B_01070 [Candidatus Sulfotelmatobacter sp.]
MILEAPGCLRAVRFLVCAALLPFTLSAQEVKQPALSPEQLVRRAVAHEVAANNSPVKHSFRSQKKTPKGSQTRLFVETTDAMAGMLIAVNDQPLSAEQQQAERGHLQWLVDNPDQLRKKHAREKEDAERTMRIIKAFPDAFLYENAGTETGRADLGRVNDVLTRLKFRPNPNYSPPSRVEQVLQGMDGYLLIDATELRIARIDGTLFRNVSFGWGFLGRLDKGGQFFVQQADIGGGDWELTQMTLKMTGKILLFKSLSMISDETFSDYKRVPENLSFAEGVELLNTEREKSASIQSADTSSVKKSSPQ